MLAHTGARMSAMAANRACVTTTSRSDPFLHVRITGQEESGIFATLPNHCGLPHNRRLQQPFPLPCRRYHRCTRAPRSRSHHQACCDELPFGDTGIRDARAICSADDSLAFFDKSERASRSQCILKWTCHTLTANILRGYFLPNTTHPSVISQ